MGRQSIERSMNFLVLAISREYQTLFPDRDVKSLRFMREGHYGDVSAAVESLEKRLPWSSFAKSLLYELQYLERVGVISPNHRQLLLYLPV